MRLESRRLRRGCFVVVSARDNRLVAPCSYQGGKQRVAAELADYILSRERGRGRVFDVCCGSGVVTLAFLSRGVLPSEITMCDAGSWGAFWRAVGSGEFDSSKFRAYCDALPRDLTKVKSFLSELSRAPADEDEVYCFLLMQAGAFGGKPVWRDGSVWRTPGFRSYWEPTATSVRRSPMNPLQPGVEELYRRVSVIAERCLGLTVVHGDAFGVLPSLSRGDVRFVYVDPPYEGVTGYGFEFNVNAFVSAVRSLSDAPVYVSEGRPLSGDAVRLFSSHKGGITANRAVQHEEWLSRFS